MASAWRSIGLFGSAVFLACSATSDPALSGASGAAGVGGSSSTGDMGGVGPATVTGAGGSTNDVGAGGSFTGSGGGSQGCAQGTEFVYLIGSDNAFYRFDPPALT